MSYVCHIKIWITSSICKELTPYIKMYNTVWEKQHQDTPEICAKKKKYGVYVCVIHELPWSCSCDRYVISFYLSRKSIELIEADPWVWPRVCSSHTPHTSIPYSRGIITTSVSEKPSAVWAASCPDTLVGEVGANELSARTCMCMYALSSMIKQ